MYMGGRWADRTNPANAQPTGWYRENNCPAGQVALKTRPIPFNAYGRKETQCGIPPAPAPAPAPAPYVPPNIIVTTTASPTFQQAFTPQVSPVIQVSSGSGDQDGGTAQTADTPQTAKGGGSSVSAGSGISADEVKDLLAQQANTQRIALEAERKRQENALIAEREQAEQAQKLQQQMITKQQREFESEIARNTQERKAVEESLKTASDFEAAQLRNQLQILEMEAEERAIALELSQTAALDKMYAPSPTGGGGGAPYPVAMNEEQASITTEETDNKAGIIVSGLILASLVFYGYNSKKGKKK